MTMLSKNQHAEVLAVAEGVEIRPWNLLNVVGNLWEKLFLEAEEEEGQGT